MYTHSPRQISPEVDPSLCMRSLFIEGRDPFAALELADLQLIKQFSGVAVKPHELAGVNVDFELGSKVIHRRDLLGSDIHAKHQAIINARRRFFGLLIGSATDTFFRSNDQETLMPVDTFMAALRTFSSVGINTRRLAAYDSRNFYASPKAIRDTAKIASEKGLNHVRLIESSPDVVRVNNEDLPRRIDYYLDCIGMSKTKLESNAFLIIAKDTTVQDKIAQLTDEGMNGEKCIKMYPTLGALSNENVSETIAHLRSRGMTTRAIEDYPSAIGLTIPRIDTSFRTMSDGLLDLDMTISASDVFNAAPEYLGAAPLKLTAQTTTMLHHRPKGGRPHNDDPATFKRLARAPIATLVAHVAEFGYFGFGRKTDSYKEMEQHAKEIAAAALLNKAKLAALGRPTVSAFIEYHCIGRPAERDRYLSITEQLAK